MFGRPRAQRGGGVLLAAATATARPKTSDDVAGKAREWQRRAHAYVRDIGELREALDYKARVMRKLVYYPAVRPLPTNEPVPLDHEESGVSPDLAAAAAVEFARLGELGLLVAGLARTLPVAGEAFVVGFPETTDPETGEPVGERWRVLSRSAVAKEAGKTVLKLDGKTITPLPEGAILRRLMLEDWEFPGVPTSPMQGVMGAAEEMAAIGDGFLAESHSRMIQAGIFYIQNQVLGPPVAVDANSPNDDQRPVVKRLKETMTAAIAQPGSAAAVVPMLLYGDLPFGEAMGHQTFARPHDPVAAERFDRCLRRFGEALTIPPEVITGLGQATDWNAREITRQSFDSYVEPDVVEYLGQLAEQVWHDLLRTSLPGRGAEIARLVIWYDDSAAVSHAASVDELMRGHEAFIVSDARTRAGMGLSEDDAPDDDEVARRLTIQQTLRAARPADQSPSSAPSEPATVTAAATSDRLAALGPALAQVDRDTLTALAEAASGWLARTLVRANARAERKLPAHPDAVRAVANGTGSVLASLGAGMSAAVGATPDFLLAGAVDDLRGRWDAIVRRAQTKALRLAASAVGADRADLEDQTTAAEQHRSAAWAWLVPGLTALAAERLFHPDMAPDSLGESTDGVTVPLGLLREALGRAGGASPAADERDPAAPNVRALGVATGGQVLAWLKDNGVFPSGWVWEHGSPTREFPPHADLDGVEFESWDDPVLAKDPGEWPPGEAKWEPSDHQGCSCICVATFTSQVEQEAAA